MADNNNQNQGKGGNNQKAVPGASVTMNVVPTDLSGPTLAGMFTLGVAFLAGLVVMNKSHGFISKRIFGVKPGEKPAIDMNPGTIVNFVKGGTVPDSGLKFIAKETFGQLSPEGQKNFLEFAQKQLAE